MTYGCYNQPRPGEHTRTLHQDGYHYQGEIIQNPRYVEAAHAMSTDCEYTKGTIDGGCNGCMWQLGDPAPNGAIPTARRIAPATT